jgi:hypothetical protein
MPPTLRLSLLRRGTVGDQPEDETEPLAMDNHHRGVDLRLPARILLATLNDDFSSLLVMFIKA